MASSRSSNPRIRETDSMATRDLTATYVHLATGPEVASIEVTPDFWPTIDERTELHTGRLVTGLTMDDDWDTWEMHPAGDEVIIFQEGTAHVHFDDGDTVAEFDVSAPDYFVVPTGTWHTMDARGHARMIVITWGEDTRHRPRS